MVAFEQTITTLVACLVSISVSVGGCWWWFKRQHRSDRIEEAAADAKVSLEHHKEENARIVENDNRWEAYIAKRDKIHERDIANVQKQINDVVTREQRCVTELAEQKGEIAQHKGRITCLEQAVIAERVERAKAEEKVKELSVQIELLKKELKDKGMTSSDIEKVMKRWKERETQMAAQETPKG